MKDVRSILCGFAAIIVLFASTEATAAGYPDFIISYWCGPPAAETTLERYREIADCGFNVAMPPGERTVDRETNRKILDACKTVGLKALIYDNRMPIRRKRVTANSPAFEKALDAIVADYSEHPALAGYYIVDEPSAGLFPALAKVNRYLLKKDPRHLPYINLYPNYAGPRRLGTGSYREHVSRFIATVKPKLVSWDHYLQMAGNETLYFRNLEVVRQESKKAKLPFIQIVLSLPHRNYRNPSEADLRWQVYTSLAYGARGIMYFTYWTIPLRRVRGPAIIGPDGKRDAKYEWVRRINTRLKALAPTLTRIESTGVYATAPLPPGTRGLAAGAPVKQAEGGPMLIGCFRGRKEETYILVVNRSFKDKITARLTMAANRVSACEISQETGKPLKAVTLKGKPLEVPLEPGDGRLFLLR